MQFPMRYGRYLLEAQIGTGGMAEVFRARSQGIEGFEKTVVIKRILPQIASDPSFVEMFIAEAKLAVGLSHPNIVQVLDLGRETDIQTRESLYIAMEFVEGADLAGLLRRHIDRHRRPFPAALAVYITAEIARALDYTHRYRGHDGQLLGLIHRDVSPQNVLLSLQGDVKLTDFGIAKAQTARNRHTQVGVLKGKYGYMSPEQVRGEPIDHRTDLFALGIMFYEMLAGRRLFRAPTPIETITLVEACQLPDFTSKLSWLPPTFFPVLNRILARDKTNRYQNAGEFLGDLIALLFAVGKPVQREDLSTFVRELVRPEVQETATDPDASALNHAEAESQQATVEQVQESRTQHAKSLSQIAPRVALQGSQEQEKTIIIALLSPKEAALGAGNPKAQRIVARYRGLIGPEHSRLPLLVFFREQAGDSAAAERAVRCALELLLLAPQARASVTQGFLSKELSHHAATEASQEARELAAESLEGCLLLGPEVDTVLPAFFPRVQKPHSNHQFLEKEHSGYLPPLSSEPLVGRRTEMRSLIESLSLASQGQGQILAVIGQSGIGKTRLLRDFRTLLQDRDMIWTTGRCAPSLVPEPYALLCDLVDNLAGCDHSNDAAHLESRLRHLRVLGLQEREIEILLQIHPQFHTKRQQDLPNPLAVADVMLHIIDELSQQSLLIIAFEDLQWIDAPSLDVLALMSAAFVGKRILVLLTWRAEEVARGERLRLKIENTPSAEMLLPPETVPLLLPPFTIEETGDFIRLLLGVSVLEDSFLSTLWHRSSGNPFFITELLRAYLERNLIDLTGKGACFVPDVDIELLPVTLEAILLEKLAGCSPEELRLLSLAAFLGQSFSREELTMLTTEEFIDVDGCCTDLVKQGIFSPQPLRNRYLFAYDMLREYCLSKLSSEERKALHEQLAVAAERSGNTEQNLTLTQLAARHYEKAGRWQEAFSLWNQIAQNSAQENQHERALESYQHALFSASKLAALQQPSLLALAVSAADLLLAKGDTLRGSQRLEELFEELPQSDPENQTAILQLRGELALQSGQIAVARNLLEQAAAQKTNSQNLHPARLPLSRGKAALFSGDTTSAIEHFSTAASLSEEPLHVKLRGEALSALGRAYVYAGDTELAEAFMKQAIALAREHNDTQTLCNTLMRKAILDFWKRDFKTALMLDQEALELAEQNGFASRAAHAAHYVGVDLFYLENLGHACSMFERSANAALELGLSTLYWTNEAYLGYLDSYHHVEDKQFRRLLSAKEKLISLQAKPKLAQCDYLLGKLYQQRNLFNQAQQAFSDALNVATQIGHLFLLEELQQLLLALRQTT